MKSLILLALLFSSSIQAKIYDAFMCYTTFDTVVLFGVLKPQGTLRINYWKLDKNPETIDLKIDRYQRSDKSIVAQGSFQNQTIISIDSKNGVGKADIDLSPFKGTEDVSFEDEDILCYFGRFED